MGVGRGGRWIVYADWCEDIPEGIFGGRTEGCFMVYGSVYITCNSRCLWNLRFN